jgi:hypothetical protein
MEDETSSARLPSVLLSSSATASTNRLREPVTKMGESVRAGGASGTALAYTVGLRLCYRAQNRGAWPRPDDKKDVAHGP